MLAVESDARAAHAIAEGRFVSQIMPIVIKHTKGVRVFDQDEHVRGSTRLEDLAELRPALKKDGSVTAGNASGLHDGAAALVLASQAAVDTHGLVPMATILGWGYAGVDPHIMGIGPIHAVPVALQRAGVTLEDIDVIESNEAFAAQACAVSAGLGFDAAKVNPNGS